MTRSLLCLSLLLAACPIPPDSLDAGTDAGTPSGTDAGVGGSIYATFSSSSTNAQLIGWTGTDLGLTSVDANGASGPSQVTLRGDSLTYGYFLLQLGGIVPGTTSVTPLQASYQTGANYSGTDSWQCNFGSTGCTMTVVLQGFDGGAIAGNFYVQFPTDASGLSTAELSGGSFAVNLP